MNWLWGKTRNKCRLAKDKSTCPVGERELVCFQEDERRTRFGGTLPLGWGGPLRPRKELWKENIPPKEPFG